MLEVRDGVVPEQDVRRLLGELSILTHLSDIVCIANRECRFVYVSRLVGDRVEADVLGTNLLDHLLPNTREQFRNAFDRCLEQWESQAVEANDVEGVWWESRMLPLKDAQGVPFVLFTSTDITSRKRAEQALSERESRVRLAIDASGVCTFAWDCISDEVIWDEGAARIFGLEPAEMSGCFADCLLRVHPDDRARVSRVAADALATGVYSDCEHRVLRKDGEVRHVLLRGSARVDADGRVLGTFGALIDVTDRKRLEERLRDVQKLDALGQLTAGIAHNFNNLLGIMLPSLALCRDQVSPEVQHKLGYVEHAAERAAELIRQLMHFATRKPDEPMESVDLSAIARRTLSICRSTFDRSIVLTLSVERGLPAVLARAGEVEQVLLNICLNARDALAGTDEPRITIEVARASAESVRVTVRDNGSGMDEATRSRVFEPFFTTKELGKGTGLGLASAYGIVADHQGRLTCESALGVGTTFSLELPIAPDEVVDAATRPTAFGAAPRGTGTLLIVDDEELVRRVMREVLARSGYSVLEASDGRDALEVLQQTAVDLMILDRSMPRMSGEQLLVRMRELGLSVPVVMLTGYAGSEVPTAGVSAVIMKPPELPVLLRTVRRVLDESKR